MQYRKSCVSHKRVVPKPLKSGLLTIRRTCKEASNKKHGIVVCEEDDHPASHKGEGESKQEPLFTNSWETNGWMKNVDLDLRRLRFMAVLRKARPPAKSGTKAEPSMKIATLRFSWSPSKA